MTPFLADTDVTVYCGDALEVLRGLPDESVHCVVTSPPFFGLRDYQAEGQIGLEASPDEWAARLVEVFRDVRRVLRRDGCLWIECGDSYNANVGAGFNANKRIGQQDTRVNSGTKPKDLVGAPWLLAFALRQDGWWLRGAYPWVKKNAMPESVRDRFTVCSSTVFQFARSPRYFFDGVAVSEPAAGERWEDQTAVEWVPARTRAELAGNAEMHEKRDAEYMTRGFASGTPGYVRPDGQRWPRGVFDIPTEPNGLALCEICGAYWERGAPAEHCGRRVTAHYAAFPQALVERIVKCSTSERGVCSVCGSPWVRELDITYTPHGDPERQNAENRANAKAVAGQATYQGPQSMKHGRATKNVTFVGWSPSCDHHAPIVPATVLDPFAGSGTSLLVARRLGRHSIGIELREAYCRLIENRTRQLSLLAGEDTA